MDALTLILLLIVLAVLGLQTWILARKKPEKKPENEAALTMLQQQLSQVSSTLDSKLTESNRAMQQQFGQSFKVIRDVTQKLTELDNTNKQVVGFAEQLQSLENILKNPKQRGILGEYYLETLLKNVLAPSQ
jgi:DNA recombination protein RmuC